jgi:hypothetical protein
MLTTTGSKLAFIAYCLIFHYIVGALIEEGPVVRCTGRLVEGAPYASGGRAERWRELPMRAGVEGAPRAGDGPRQKKHVPSYAC